MKFDITWTITAVIAVSSFLSPVVVSIINNKHHTEIRKMELKHNETIRFYDIQQQLSTRQSDIYYADKKEAFSKLLKVAGTYLSNTKNSIFYSNLLSALQECMLFCSSKNQALLIEFLDYAESIYYSDFSSNIRINYSKTLTNISIALNEELQSTKPVIDRKQCEHQ